MLGAAASVTAILKHLLSEAEMLFYSLNFWFTLKSSGKVPFN